MIRKFQQGGILAKIQQLPEDQQTKIMQAFAKWAQDKGINIQQLQQNPQALEQALGQFIQEVESGEQPQEQQPRAIRHGAKLNYIKSLKHQCAEDEELYYYKKGGKVGCGCKKKENGGEVEKAQKGIKAVDKFKKDQAAKDSIEANVYNNQDIQNNTSGKTPGSYKKDDKGKMQWTPDRTKSPYNKKVSKKCGGGCAKKIKMQSGGSLNGIPFTRKELLKKGVNPMYTSRKIGNISIEHTNDDLDKINEPNWERKYGAYSKWHIIDPNKGYNFEIHSGRLRDGGSQTLRSWGDSIPQELKNLDGLRGGLINYRGFKDLSPNDSTIIANRRNLVNSILNNYGLNFKE